MLADEHFLVEIFSFVLFLVHPKFGIHLLDLQRHQSGEYGVTSILCGSRQDGEVEVFLNVEILVEEACQLAPLVEAQIVQYEEKHFTPLAQLGKHFALENIRAE